MLAPGGDFWNADSRNKPVGYRICTVSPASVHKGFLQGVSYNPKAEILCFPDRKKCPTHRMASAAPEFCLLPSLEDHLKSYCQRLPCRCGWAEPHLRASKKLMPLAQRQSFWELKSNDAGRSHDPSLIYWLQNKWRPKREEHMLKCDPPFKVTVKSLHVEQRWALTT